MAKGDVERPLENPSGKPFIVRRARRKPYLPARQQRKDQGAEPTDKPEADSYLCVTEISLRIKRRDHWGHHHPRAKKVLALAQKAHISPTRTYSFRKASRGARDAVSP